MSFYSSLMFYRPTEPPVVTGQSLAAFVRAFDNLGVAEGNGLIGAQLKFGERIDQDEKPAIWEIPVVDCVFQTAEIEWDFTPNCQSLSELASELTGKHESVYRGHLFFNNATGEICQQLQRRDSPENKIDLTLDGWSMEIGPIESVSLSSERTFTVGWMSVNISGWGYLFPWTTAELVERAERLPRIRRVMELCRETWPVSRSPPSCRERVARRRMGELWPYPRRDLPWDWYWGVHET